MSGGTGRRGPPRAPRVRASRGGAAARAWPLPWARLLDGWTVPLAGLLLAAVVRSWALRWQPFVTVDGTEYVRFAEALRAGHGFASIFPPGYPVLVALARLVVADRVFSAALVSWACGVALVVPVWALARRAVGTRWAALPVLAVALHPLLAVFSAVTMSESAYFLALYGGLALLAAGRPLPSGLALGAAFATRPEALLPATVLALGGLVRALRGRARPRAVALGVGGFLLVAVPCWLWFHATLGEWTLTPKVEVAVAVAEDWRLTEARIGAPAEDGPRGLAGRLLHHGPGLLRQYPGNAVAYGRALLRLWPLPLLLLSLAWLWRRRGLVAVPLLVLVALPLLGVSVQPRFLLGAVPALAILAAVPFTFGPRAWTAAAGALALAGAVWCGAGLARDLETPFDGWIHHQRDAGAWLSGVAARGDVVMDRKPWVAFYGRCGYDVMPDEPYEAIVATAVRDRVRWLVVDQRVTEIFRAQLEPLLYDGAFRDRERRLELVYVGGRVAGYGIGIFRVLQPGEAKSGRPPVVEAAYLR
jgi:hypothetical protein